MRRKPSIIVSGKVLAACLRATADAVEDSGGVALFSDQFPLLSFMALMLYEDPAGRDMVMFLINRMNAEVLDAQCT